MARRVIGLDVGTYSVKVLHLENEKRGTATSVVAYAEKLLSDFVLEENDDDTRPMLLRQQEAALFFLKNEGFFADGTIVTGLAGTDAQVRNLQVPFSSTKKIQAVLGGLLDSQLPIDIADLVTSWSLKKSASKSQNQILLAFAKKTSVKSCLDFLKNSAVEPRYLTTKSAGLFDTLQYLIKKAPPGAAKTFAIVDLGHQSTGICVGTADNLFFARSVLRGELDVTKALAVKLKLSESEAEKGKKERGFIETNIGKAKMLEGHLMSEALKECYQPVIRELRQTNLALEATGEEGIAQIFLVGGGSKLKSLDLYFSDVLQIKTSSVLGLDLPQALHVKALSPAGGNHSDPQMALAASYASYGFNTNKNPNHFDLRKDEFSCRGELSEFRKIAGRFGIWACVLFVLLLTYGLVKNGTLDSQLDAIKLKEQAACKSVLSKNVDTGAKCLTMIKNQIAGKGLVKIPEFSAVHTYIAISKALPDSLNIKATEINITDSKIRINGETSTFESVDEIVAALAKVPCVTDVDKGRASQTAEFVRFQITADLDCEDTEEKKSSVKKKSRRTNR